MSEGHTERLEAALEGRYRVERQLGEGGMATVYLAKDLRHNRSVALKVLKPELAAVVGGERFLAEIETTANLQHPHILPLFDSGEADGLLFYVMPHVEGESLRSRLDREHQLPVDEAVRIATNVAEALDYAHRQGVIHRDIKPANILLLDGKPVIADFGIALAVSHAGSGRLTETGLSLGTPHYMSPEQATGDGSVGPATDIWALGCVLYEMLVGEPPYTGGTPQAVLGKIITAEPASITGSRRSVPPNMDAAIRRALEKVPADRFGTALELADALADEHFRFEHFAERRTKRVRAWRMTSVAALGAAVGLVLGSGLHFVFGEPASDGLGAHLQLLLPQGTFLPLDSDYPLIAVSPDGTQIALTAERREGGRQLYVRALGDSDWRAVTDTEGALAPFYSPDGRWIGFHAGSMVYRVPSTGGAPIPTHRISGEGVHRGTAWVSGASLTYVASSNSGLLEGSISGDVSPNTAWDSLTTASEPAAWPAPVSGTTDVVFATTSGSAASQTQHVDVVSATSGERRRLINGASSPRFSHTGHLLFARGSVLHAVRYDPRARETSGDEREIVRGVAMAGHAVSHYAVGGNVLAYVGGPEISGDNELVWVDRTGEVVAVLQRDRRFSDPRISPDGGRVAVTVTEGANLDVWLLDLARNTLQPLTRHPGEDFEPLWRPDGSSIALASEVGEDAGEGGPALAWIPTLGGPVEQLLFTPEPGAWEFPTSWTPDGRAIVVTQRREGRSADVALFRLGSPDGDLIPLLDSPADESGGQLSPDGSWLAYTSNQSGRNEIWVRPFLSPGASVQVSSDGGAEAVWSADSREIFYRSGPDMMVVEVSSGGEPVLGQPRRLFAGRFERNLFGGNSAGYDVSPDGDRFLMVRRTESVQPTVLNLVLNWPSVLGSAPTPGPAPSP